MSRQLNKPNSCQEVGEHFRSQWWHRKRASCRLLDFVPWTPEKIVFIEDGSKNLFVYETINGRGIMEAKCAGKLSWGHTTPCLPPKHSRQRSRYLASKYLISPDFSFILEQALITRYRVFNHLYHHVRYLYGFFSIGQLYVSLPIHPSSQTQCKAPRWIAWKNVLNRELWYGSWTALLQIWVHVVVLFPSILADCRS